VFGDLFFLISGCFKCWSWYSD